MLTRSSNIFATPQRRNSFILSKNKIELIDFKNNHYIIISMGELIE